MVIALKGFGGFAGFETWELIKEHFGKYTTLVKFFADKINSIEKEAETLSTSSEKNKRAFKIKSLLEYIIDVTDPKKPSKMSLKIELNHQKQPNPKICLKNLVRQLKSEICEFESFSVRDRVTLQLIDQYNADVGILITLLLQYIELQPLESMLLAPNVPHCYFKGEIVEIMHSSNNVIRLGLTKKFKDKKNLLRLVDYQHDPLYILNQNRMRKNRKDLRIVDLNEFLLNYSTKFDHLFRVNIIYRDGRGESNDMLFYIQNNLSFEELKEAGCQEISKIGPFDKDSIVLNLGASIKIRRNREGDFSQEVRFIRVADLLGEIGRKSVYWGGE